MAIEITEFADVSISVSPVGVSGGNFGILGFLGLSSDDAINPISPTERARAYTSLKTVSEDWNANSEVFKAAQAFYGQTPTPTDFVAIMSYDTAQQAVLKGGLHLPLEEIIVAPNMEFNVTLDGGTVSAVEVDLSSASTLDDVASTINALVDSASTGSTCTYENGVFVIKSVTTGATSSVSFATGDVAEVLGLDQSKARSSVGVDIETPTESLAAAVDKGIDFVGLVTDKSMRDDKAGSTVVEIAQAATGFKKIFCNTTNDITTLTSSENNVAAKLKAITSNFVMTTFSNSPNEYPSAAAFGRVASVNFNGFNTTMTLNLKQLAGVTAEDLTPSELGHLRSKFANAVVKIGKSVNAFTDSRMSSGTWLDTTHGVLWLENRCETDLFNTLYLSPDKIPFNQTGINIVEAALDRALQAAVTNGLASAGFLPDGTFLPRGFRINAPTIDQVPAGDKGNRIYSGMTFDMVGAGALHEVIVSGSFSE